MATAASEIVAGARGWLPLASRECPVHPRTFVQVRCEFELDFDDEQLPRRAGNWDWSNHGDVTTITHWREVRA